MLRKEYIRKANDDLMFEIQIINFGRTAQEEIRPKQEKWANQIEFKVGQNYIYKVFLERDKTNRYRTYDKEQIIEKLWNKQNILIPSIEMRGNDIVFIKDKLYSFSKVFNKPEYYFAINISPIAFDYENYIYIDLNELKEIEKCRDEYWEKISKTQPESFKRVKRIIANQICRAAPIKFNILIKSKYHPENNFKTKNTGYTINCCRVSEKEQNIALGDIDFEITRVLQNSHFIRKHKKNEGLSETFKSAKKCVLGCTFYVAKKLEWLVSFPKYDEKKQEWIFSLNASYFDFNAKRENLTALVKR